MKNFKILRKVMLLALVLAVVVGAFAVNGSAETTDAIEVTITDCAEKHDGTANTHTGLGSTVNTVITNTPDSFNVKKVCMDSGIAFENYFVTSTIANEIKDVVVDKYTTGTLTINDANGIVNGSSDYWIAADINTRDGFAAPTSDTTLITVGGSPVLKLDAAGKLVMADGIAVGDALVAKNSYALALNMIPTANAGYYDCAVYIESELVGTAKNISVGDATVQLDAYDNLRLLNIKAVKLGNTGTAVAVKSVAETEAMPCVGHTPKADSYIWYQNPVDATTGVNDLMVSYMCERCGERLYEKQGANLYASTNTYFKDDAVWSVAADHITSDIYRDPSVALTDGYWVVFDLEIVSLNIDKVAAKDSSPGNGNLLNQWGTTDSVLRFYTIGDKDGDTTTLDYELSELVTEGTHYGVSKPAGVYNTKYLLLASRIDSAKNSLAIVTAGETYRIAVYAPHKLATEAKVFVDGELLTSTARSVAKLGEKALRLKDETYGAFNISNFSFVNAVNTEYAPHVHTDKWSEGYTIVNGYNTFDLAYTCYCGETIPLGSAVSEYVKLDSVYYGKAEIENLPTTDDYWFTTNYYIATAEALAEATNVISLGDYSVLSAGELDPEVGKTYEIAVNVSRSTENAAVSVYVDNKLVKKATVAASELGDTIVLGDTEGTDVRFRYSKAVKIGAVTTPVPVEFNDTESKTLKPCYHKGEIEKFAVAKGAEYGADKRIQAVNKLIKKFTCTECGEIVYEPQGDVLTVDQTTVKDSNERYIQLDATGSYIGNTVDGEGDTFNDHSYIVTDYASVGTSATPYWISFDYKFEADSTQMAAIAKKTKNQGGGGSFLALRAANARKFMQFMRGYSVDKPEGGYYEDRYAIKIDGGNAPLTGIADWANVVLMAGQTYNVSLYVEPGTEGYYYTLYVDGENVGTGGGAPHAAYSATNEIFMFRFLDGGYGDFSISNFAFVKEAPAHVHTDKWSAHFIETGYNTLDEYYTCYCGDETVKVGSLTDIVKNNLDNVYYGVGTVDGLPTEGDYWLTTNYYITNDDAVAKADSIVSLGSYELLGADEIELKSKTAYQIAVNTVYTDEKVADIYVYVNGKLVKPALAVDLSAAGNLGVVTLGGGERNTDIRFGYTKAVKTGKDTPVNTKVTYNDAVDGSIEPCIHAPKADTYKWYKNLINTQTGVYDLVYSYVCDKCGEIVYIKQGASLYSTTSSHNTHFKDDGVFQIDAVHGSSEVHRDSSVALTHGYWVSFDVEIVDLAYHTIAKKKDGGGNLLKVNENNNSVLRIYSIADIDGNTTTLDYELSQLVTNGTHFGVETGYNTKAVLLRDKFSSTNLAILEEGKTYSIAIYSEYNTNNTTRVYIDGKLVCAKGESFASWKDVALRIKDGAYGVFNISNFSFVNAVADYVHSADHVHNDKWTAPTEKRVVMTDTSIEYYYKCYCGATVTAGIDEVLKDAITPKYNVTEETVMLPVSEYDMSTAEKEFWLLTNVKVNNYPASSQPCALISIGDTDLVSIDNVGNIKVGGADTEAVLTNRTYMPFAIKFDVSTSTYYVYYERVCIGKGTVDTLAADIKVAGGNSGNYHFDRMALVALAADSNLSFTSGDDGHVHANLPQNTSLVFNADKTTVQLQYFCSVCDKFIKEGIKTNLYDDPTDDIISTVAPVYGGETSIKTVSELINSETPFWISMYATLEGNTSYAGNNSFAALVSDNGDSIALLSLGVEGLVKDVAGHSLGRIGTAETNITMSVIEVDGKHGVRYYIDGKYCATRQVELDSAQAYELVLGNDEVATLSLTDIKLAELAVGTNYAIGAYVCRDGHTIAVNSKTVIEYFDVNSFKVFYNCAVCGTSASDEVVASYYDSTPHIYEAEGEVGKDAVEGINASAYWISVDVNVRTGTFGKFNGYVPLVSYNGTAYLLINSNGDLMLGDGTKLSVRMPMYKITTYNVALRYDTESGKLCAFVDGKYVGCSTGTVDEIGIQAANKREHFGAPQLENIRYYNIKSVVTGAAPANKISLEFVENVSYVPCAHNQFYQSVGVILKTGETIREIYICDTCGERYTVYRDNNLLDMSLPHSKVNGIETGSFTVTTAATIYSTADIMSSASTLGSDPYWVRFTVEAEKIIDGDALVAKKGRAVTTSGVIFFSTTNAANHGHLLRLFPVAKPTGGYYDDRAELRTGNSSNAQLVTTIYEGETYDFAIRVTPANGVFRVYLDGEYVTTQKSSALSAGRDKYFFCFLNGAWGTYKVSNFEFVTGAAHEHTSKYVPYMNGGYDVLAYGDATLTHRYSCYCGEDIVEGIDEIHLDAILDMSVSAPTAINGAADVAMGYKPYWVSAKVHYGETAATVYSIGGTSLVETVGTDSVVYKVGGVETDVVASLNDYDVVSMRVEPESGEYYAYVNGAFIGAGKYDFGINSKFDILFGGDTALRFTNIKLVSLAEGADGKVMVCGDHAYSGGSLTIKSVKFNSAKKVTTLECECKLCHENVTCTVSSTADITATPVNDKGEPKDDYVFGADGSFNVGDDGQLVVYYAFDKASVVDDKTPYWFSFDVRFNDVPYIKEGENAPVPNPASLYNKNAGRNLMNFHKKIDSAVRVFPVVDSTDADGNPTYKTDSVELKTGREDKALPLVTLTKGDSVNIATRVDISGDTPVVDIFVDGVLKVTRTDAVIDVAQNMIRFGDACGSFTISNMRLYRAEIAAPVAETFEQPKLHMPTSTNPGTITYGEEGSLKHEFVCAVCSTKTQTVTHEYDYITDLYDASLNKGKVITEFLGVTSTRYMNVSESVVSKAGAPYWFFVDISADVIYTSAIQAKGNKGASIVMLTREYDTNGDGKISNGEIKYIDLLRVYYRDGKVVLDSPMVSGKTLERDLIVGKTLRYAFAVDPVDGTVLFYVDGDYCGNGTGALATGGNQYKIAFSVGKYADFDFTNIKLVKLTDQCTHDATCADGATYNCGDCGMTVPTVHNYVATLDATKMWTKYTCENCEKYHIEFNDKSLLVDEDGNELTFATNALLLEYLTKTYMPVFPTKEIVE